MRLGKRTAFIGKNVTKGTVIGGTCVNVGCVPSKNLITIAGAYAECIEDSPFSNIFRAKGSIDFTKAMQEKDALVDKFRKEKYSEVLMDLKNVEYFPELGQFLSKDEVKAGEKSITAEKFVIATGARAKIPNVDGIENVEYLTNEEALSLHDKPESMVIVGGRSLGLEFAQMYAHFGTKVTLLQRSDRILPEEEPEISESLSAFLKEDGVEIHTNAELMRLEQSGHEKILRAKVDGTEREFRSQQILFATGRMPNTEGLHQEKAGVETDGNGFIKVNNQMQTSSPLVWAAGDVIGKPMLETIAAKEGSIAVSNAFSNSTKEKRRINYDEVPRATFTTPEVASVGLTEEEADSRGVKCNCTVLPLEQVPKAQIIHDTRGLVKMVVDWETKKIIGVHTSSRRTPLT